MPFPNINYQYWSQQNPFYQNLPIFETIRTSLTHYASRPGLINDVIDRIETLTCLELVNLIQTEIKEIINEDQIENDIRILRVFDLIQGWGGKMGKSPYVPYVNPVRNNPNTWIHNYKLGIQLSIQGNPEGLTHFENIPKIGVSFGSKHLSFWSRFGGNNNAIPIYDARIQTLLYFNQPGIPSYSDYIRDMVEFSNNIGIDINQLEMALFGFSSNYFPNNNLNIIQNFEDNTDENEARNLNNLFNQ
jgi:hypothetical protein